MYDYVYDVGDLRALKGSRYDAKRALIKKFGGYYAEVCELDASTAADFIRVEEEWCILKECAKKKALSDEDTAVREALANFQELKLSGVCLKIWGNIKGFAIGEPLNSGTYVGHFEKASIGFNGIYQALLNEFAKRIPNEFVLLNMEQDLGVEGLRKAKESYHPVKMIEKFIVKRKA